MVEMTIASLAVSGNLYQFWNSQGGGIYNAHLQDALSLPMIPQQEVARAVADPNVTIGNSVIASNIGGIGVENCAVSSTIDVGPYLSLGSNIKYGTTCGLLEINDFPNTNPLLCSLGNYGRPTYTQPPLPGSPAIDHGSGSPTLDQRCAARNDGDNNGTIICDIGSTEYNPVINLFLSFIRR